jgi:hypothetical protein
MDNEQSEDVQLNGPIALYKVSYLFNNELFSIDLILNKNMKNGQGNYISNNKIKFKQYQT